MYKQTEIADRPSAQLNPGDVPIASPYYDRLRSLALERDFAPVGSPEFQMIDRQINELTERARKRMNDERNYNHCYDK